MDGLVATSRPTLPRQVWTFVRHYVEMCIAMCIGVGITSFALRTAAGALGTDLRAEWPWISLVAISVGISLPMIAWMRFRGMSWRPIIEMTVAGSVAVLLAAWFGAISPSAVTVGTVCGVACVSMFAAMLFRLDLYTGRTGHDHRSA